MSQPNLKKGELLYKRLIHLLICSLKQVPVVGGIVEFAAGWQEVANKFRQEQEQLNLVERVVQLEEAAAMSPVQAREIAKVVIAEERQQGQTISRDQEEAVLDLASSTPATIRERTQATLRQARQYGTAAHTVLPVGEGFTVMEQNEFYRSLLPARRPRFREGEPVPHGHPRWRLTQLIGAGGFGEVWEVRHQQLKDSHAVKFCQDSVSAKVLKREAAALFKLHEDLPKHPHIVSLEDLSLEVEPYWLAFEYVSGGTLEALMRAKRFTWEEALGLFVPLVQGMSAVHQVGIVHRDLKPANILLTPEGVPKIADFGIGKVMVEQEIAQTQTRFTTLGAGSLGYVSPEQAEGQPAHPTDDVYSLAVILWQMLSYTLKPPIYVQDSLEDLEIPEEAKRLVLDCLRPRKKRPQDAGELLKRLQLVKGGKAAPPAKASAKASSPPADDRKGQLFTFETVLVDRRGQIIKRTPGQARQTVIDLGKGVTLEMVYIPAGTFLMGAAPNEAEAQPSEYPQHQVTLKSFCMGKYPVTQAQWQAIMGNNSSYFKGENRPVEQVSWDDAKAFCDRLSQRTGQTFRLPSEAEWEYACRAGTPTPFYFGETITPDLVNYDGNNPYGEAPKGEYRQETTPVGSFPPNAFGLYDMHGNVREWCEDVWHENYEGAPTDGSAWETGGGHGYRLLRGGSWNNRAVWCRAASRSEHSPVYRYPYVGLRVVRCAVWTS
jgi:formylglycine-generating enzyme required for sulfatase activity/uncharacterized protein with PIN domain